MPVGSGRPATGDSDGAEATQHSPTKNRAGPLPVQDSPCTSRTAPLPVQNSPSTLLLTACAVQNSPCSPKMAQFGTFFTRMANFLPFSPARSPAWRTLYRCRQEEAVQGELCTACEAETGLAITAHQPSPARRAPQGQEDQAAVPVGDDDTTANQISHIIYRGYFSRHHRNVAIPMTCVHSLKHSRGNYVRSC